MMIRDVRMQINKVITLGENLRNYFYFLLATILAQDLPKDALGDGCHTIVRWKDESSLLVM
jgi:hypothetical protein